MINCEYYLNFQDGGHLAELAPGLFLPLLLDQLLPGLVLLDGQGLELSGEFASKVQGLDDLVVLCHCGFLVVIQFLASLLIPAVSVQFTLNKIENSLINFNLQYCFTILKLFKLS